MAAFHVACPITCQRICFCKLGFPQKLQTEKGRANFLEEISRVEEFLSDPWSLRVKESEIVKVSVPKIVLPVLPPTTTRKTIVIDGEDSCSVPKRQASMEKSIAGVSLGVEEFGQRVGPGVLVEVDRERYHDLGEENADASTIKGMCNICFTDENEASERAVNMLDCKFCHKKYHKSCLKTWAQYRDLFHPSSWACPSCRVCEVCRRTGDPLKLMYCKRCDGAYHCYCQQPSHRTVATGPYLCPKHTRCHSCESTVPGNGPSTRWFLGYNYCDACGRLFVKGNYCPVCLKVYRDSESIPMVCCDVCERWVHCHCDGISDEKYLQFQADRNLYYECNACRGECYQVKDLDDAVQELWRRRDHADREQILSLRASAGLPSQDDICSMSPYSDDEESNPAKSKTGYGRSLKISVKGISDKSVKTPKEYTKKSSNKKYTKKKGYKETSNGKTVGYENFERLNAAQSIECNLADERIADMQDCQNGTREILSSVNPVNYKENNITNKMRSMRNSFTGDVAVNNEERAPRVLHIKSSKSRGEGTGKHGSKPDTVKGTKLVIHLGARNRNIMGSPISEASSCHYAGEDANHRKTIDRNYMVDEHEDIVRHGDVKGETRDNVQQFQGSKYTRKGSWPKLRKHRLEASEGIPTIGGDITGHDTLAVEPITEATTLLNDKIVLRKHSERAPNLGNESQEIPSGVHKDLKPLLKLKFKNPYRQNNDLVSHVEEERSSIKGQRSKRKRTSPTTERSPMRDDDGDSQLHSENPINEAIDANWILKKLGKDANGKRVEVHQPSDGSWHKAVVTDMLDDAATLAVLLDDGRAHTLELGKQRVRFYSQK